MCPENTNRRLLTGWGRTAPSGGDIYAPLGFADLEAVLNAPSSRGLIARGLGRSYGDAAQNAGGVVLDVTSLRGIHRWDASAGLIEVDAGLSLDDLMRWTIPRGWFPGVVPGTRFVTIGGAIAADIHGKNHHADGTFTDSLVGFTLCTPSGTRQLGPDDELFWATAGGMGLTGVVSKATLRLRPIESAHMLVDTERATNLDDLLARMDERDHEYRYSVAWIDCLTTGRQLGRAVLTRGDHAPAGELSVPERERPLHYAPAQVAAAPPWVPDGVLNRLTIRAFNELWYRKAPKDRHGEVQSISTFFHPLDGVADWNRFYGSRGFLQYQFLVPFGEEPLLGRIVTALAKAQVASFLAVLKRFGDENRGHLSFPAPGWTLALDLPLGDRRLGPMLDRFDEQVASAGGRVYLAKDSRMRPEMLPTMYPRLGEWRELRASVDPGGVLTSDLDRRLHLTKETI